MNFALGLYIGLGLGALIVFLVVLEEIRIEARRRHCDHQCVKQGDIIFWPFDTPAGRITITWCARCGATRMDSGRLTNGGWQRINAYEKKELT